MLPVCLPSPFFYFLLIPSFFHFFLLSLLKLVILSFPSFSLPSFLHSFPSFFISPFPSFLPSLFHFLNSLMHQLITMAFIHSFTGLGVWRLHGPPRDASKQWHSITWPHQLRGGEPEGRSARSQTYLPPTPPGEAHACGRRKHFAHEKMMTDAVLD